MNEKQMGSGKKCSCPRGLDGFHHPDCFQVHIDQRIVVEETPQSKIVAIYRLEYKEPNVVVELQKWLDERIESLNGPHDSTTQIERMELATFRAVRGKLLALIEEE